MREELGAVSYSMKDSFTPRELTVLIPGFIDENDHRFVVKSVHSNNSLLDKINQQN